MSYLKQYQTEREFKVAGSPPRPRSAAPRPRKKGATMRMSSVLRAHPQLFASNRIAVVEKYVTALDALPPRYQAAETVFLSKNSLRSLRGVEQFGALRTFSASDNRLGDLDEIDHLLACPSLKVLSLERNPFTSLPYFRYHVIHRLKRLERLDGADVNAAERSLAATVVAKEAATLEILVQNQCMLTQLQSTLARLELHAEFRDLVVGRVSILNRTEGADEAFDARTFLQLWDYEGQLSSLERMQLQRKLREAVSEVWVSHVFGGDVSAEEDSGISATNRGTYDEVLASREGSGWALRPEESMTAKAINSIRKHSAQAALESSRLRLPDAHSRMRSEYWDVAYAAFLAEQQQQLAELNSELELQIFALRDSAASGDHHVHKRGVNVVEQEVEEATAREREQSREQQRVAEVDVAQREAKTAGFEQQIADLKGKLTTLTGSKAYADGVGAGIATPPRPAQNDAWVMADADEDALSSPLPLSAPVPVAASPPQPQPQPASILPEQSRHVQDAQHDYQTSLAGVGAPSSLAHKTPPRAAFGSAAAARPGRRYEVRPDLMSEPTRSFANAKPIFAQNAKKYATNERVNMAAERGALKQQVAMLMGDIERRVTNEARLHTINVKLRERLEQTQAQNEQSITAATTEISSVNAALAESKVRQDELEGIGEAAARAKEEISRLQGDIASSRATSISRQETLAVMHEEANAYRLKIEELDDTLLAESGRLTLAREEASEHAKRAEHAEGIAQQYVAEELQVDLSESHYAQNLARFTLMHSLGRWKRYAAAATATFIIPPRRLVTMNANADMHSDMRLKQTSLSLWKQQVFATREVALHRDIVQRSRIAAERAQGLEAMQEKRRGWVMVRRCFCSWLKHGVSELGARPLQIKASLEATRVQLEEEQHNTGVALDDNRGLMRQLGEASLLERALRSDIAKFEDLQAEWHAGYSEMQKLAEETAEKSAKAEQQLAHERREQTALISDLRRRLKTSDEALRQARQETDESQNALDEVSRESQHKLASAFEIAASLRKMLRDKDSELNRMESGAQAVSGAMHDRVAQSDYQEQRAEELRERNLALSAEVDRAGREVSDCRHRLEEKDRTIRKLQSEIRLQADIRQAQTADGLFRMTHSPDHSHVMQPSHVSPSRSVWQDLERSRAEGSPVRGGGAGITATALDRSLAKAAQASAQLSAAAGGGFRAPVSASSSVAELDAVESEIEALNRRIRQ